TAGRNTEPASPLREHINEDNTCVANSHGSSQDDDTCGTTDVARARWTLLRQVLRRKQVDSPEVKQVSVRRFATFDLFNRKRLVTQDPSDTSDDQWVEYRSVYFPEYSALLSLKNNRAPTHAKLHTQTHEHTLKRSATCSLRCRT
ncbi:Calmodulin-lysine N-methyltransferase, partial [Nibea albiflora]